MKNAGLLLGTIIMSLLLFSFSGKEKSLNTTDLDCLNMGLTECLNPFAEGLLLDEEVTYFLIQ